ncbi:MAG: serine acetyltransferase [Lachnospiraceae bacterium]|nr:serine acetyltransferase [Lachnospiraceae bacterium]MBR5067353.1 serine acetyltransferase [Lachnospiraceae bacterium]MBR5917785.1 serine acetyltransferase [Lachnospiraceae bacterium]
MNTGYVNLKQQVTELIGYIRSMLYPEIFGEMGYKSTEALNSEAHSALCDMLATVCEEDTNTRDLADKFFAKLPEIKALLDTDVQAAYEGDPAAKSTKEVMLAYPAFEAISIFRIAHELYEQKVPILPRMMTEYAHRTTGIDMHPGAKIGPYFFIDHGTGVVIGETTTIGERVKLYQGVTLGAKSFAVNPDGTLVKGIKRHPDIGNNVVIYAGATILGGSTSIGDNCVIGGNVWLTHSVDAGSTVLAAHERNEIISKEE